MAGGNSFSFPGVDTDRLDPMKGILEDEVWLFSGEGEDELVREKWIFWRGP